MSYPLVAEPDRETIHINEPGANAFINKHKKLYIIKAASNYLEHKKSIYGNTRFYYCTLKKQESIGFVENTVKGLKTGFTLDMICRQILRIENHFVRILPHSQNKSFQSSRISLKDILDFCRRETGLYKKYEQIPMEL